MDEKVFYSVSEAADFLGVSKTTMYRYLIQITIKSVDKKSAQNPYMQDFA